MIERVRPHSLESEMALLCCVLAFPRESAYADTAPLVRPEDFYRTAHGEIWAALGRLDEAGKTLDPTNLLTEVGADVEHLSRILQVVDNPFGAQDYAATIVEASRARAVIEHAAMATEVAFAHPADAPRALEKAAEAVRVGGTAASGHVSEGMTDALDELCTRIDTTAGQGGNLSWRIAELRGGYIQPGDFVVVAGGPGSGKSSWLLQWATQTAATVQRPVIYVSLEMPPRQVRKVLALQQSRVHDPQGQGLAGEEAERIYGAGQYIEGLPLYFPENAPRNASAFASWVRAVAQTEKPCVFVVDYLGLLQGEGDNRTTQVGQISRALRAAALKSDVPIVAIHSMNRSSASERRKPQLRDLRDSGQIEFDATHVLFLWRYADKFTDEQRDEMTHAGRTSRVHLITRKMRNGPTDIEIEMAFNGATRRMDPVAKESR